MRPWPILVLVLVGCNSPSTPPPVGQWTCYHCMGMSLEGNGSFTFPDSSGAVGYIYTTPGRGTTVTLTYTVGGSGTVLPSPASGQGDATVRLFLWRKGDDLACSSTTEWYRWWSQSGVGPLTVGQHTISATLDWSGWTDCLARQDAGQFAGTLNNLLGVGFTFGAEFYGHGVYSNGGNTFTINNWSVQ